MLGFKETNLESQFLSSWWAPQGGEKASKLAGPLLSMEWLLSESFLAWGWSQKGEEAIFGEAWTGPLPHQDKKAMAIFPLVDLQRGFISPTSHPLQRPVSLQSREYRPLSGFCFLPGDTRELERLFHGGLIPPPSPPLRVSSGCCR